MCRRKELITSIHVLLIHSISIAFSCYLKSVDFDKNMNLKMNSNCREFENDIFKREAISVERVGELMCWSENAHMLLI